MEKVKVTRIVLTRKQGPAHLCDKPRTVYSWEEADHVLWEWAMFAPKDGDVNDVDYKVIFEDGHVMGGTFFLADTHQYQFHLLPKHIQNELGRMALGAYDRFYPMLSEVAKETLKKYDLKPSYAKKGA